MTNQGETLRLVTEFGDLGVGMPFAYMPCAACGQSHRGILMSPVLTDDGEMSFQMEPTPSCRESDDAWGVGQKTIDARKLFRILDGYDPAAEAEARRKVIVADRLVEVLRGRGLRAERLP